jgi:hypothetical protein
LKAVEEMIRQIKINPTKQTEDGMQMELAQDHIQ